MMDEEDGPHRLLEHGREMLLYDFFKHLTSLAILVLGGMLIVAKDFDPSDVKPTSVLIAMATISAGGICAFSGSSEIVRAKITGTQSKRSLKALRIAAPALLAIGTGYFLSMFADSLV